MQDTGSMLLLTKVRGTAEKASQICCSSSRSVLGFDQQISSLAHPYKKTTCGKIKTSQSPGHRKMPVTECTNRKYKMWRHSIFQEV
jgi:hypothetical protein